MENTIFLTATALGGSLGALGRYALSLWASRRIGSRFPFGTLLCNVIGCLILGLMAGAISANVIDKGLLSSFVNDGFCGALTTFSTFSWESFTYFRNGHFIFGILYLCISLIVCISASSFGYILMM